MELLRALGAVIEKPDASVTRLAAMIELPTQPTAASQRRRLEAKRQRSRAKGRRRREVRQRVMLGLLC